MNMIIESLPNEILSHICMYYVSNNYGSIRPLCTFKLVCAKFYDIAMLHPMSKIISNIIKSSLYDNKKYVDELEVTLFLAIRIRCRKAKKFVDNTIINSLIDLGIDTKNVTIGKDNYDGSTLIRISNHAGSDICVSVNNVYYKVSDITGELCMDDNILQYLYIFKNIVPDDDIKYIPTVLERWRLLHKEMYSLL